MSTMVSEETARVTNPLTWVKDLESEYIKQKKVRSARNNAQATLDRAYRVGQVVVPKGTKVCIFPGGSSAIRATMTMGDLVINILSRGGVQVKDLSGPRHAPARDRIGVSARLFATRL